MIKDVIVIEGNVTNWDEALKLTSDQLFKKGYVKKSFYKGCIEREKKFPTGLPTIIPVAIPHTDSIHVNIPAVCVLRLEKPVSFNSMESADETVNVEYVFNMALNKENDQLNMIREIINVVQDNNFLSMAKTMPIDELRKVLCQKWLI